MIVIMLMLYIYKKKYVTIMSNIVMMYKPMNMMREINVMICH